MRSSSLLCITRPKPRICRMSKLQHVLDLPSNACELEAQSTLLRTRIQQHQNSSPTQMLQSLDCLTRGARMVMHSARLLRDQVSALQKANEAATKRKARKKKADPKA